MSGLLSLEEGETCGWEVCCLRPGGWDLCVIGLLSQTWGMRDLCALAWKYRDKVVYGRKWTCCLQTWEQILCDLGEEVITSPKDITGTSKKVGVLENAAHVHCQYSASSRQPLSPTLKGCLMSRSKPRSFQQIWLCYHPSFSAQHHQISQVLGGGFCSLPYTKEQNEYISGKGDGGGEERGGEIQ